MTRDEVKKILTIIDATYPNFKVDNLTETLDAWHFFLSDYEYNRIAIALKTYVTTQDSGFAPNVNQLIAIANKTQEYSQIPDTDAWALVYKALSNSAYHSREEFEKLPALVQKAVGSPTQLHLWATSTDFNHGVESSNFKRTYNRLAERERELATMPVEMKSLIKQESERMMLNG